MVSTLMEFVNFLIEQGRHGQWKTADFQKSLETLLVIMAPAAPHICEELWCVTGHTYSVHQQSWPTWDEELACSQSTEIGVQVDGKLRGVVLASDGMGDEEVEAHAKSLPRVAAVISGRTIQNVIYVPGRMINFVTVNEQALEDGAG